ncbi:hypothetical protein BFQ28_15260 [Citrobacter freundii]|uniref:hypothetical protein n=1 Tax=Citrobacter freundii TaxID=546 RepID=UPI0008413E7D|nr:hypothetical protein [Citrobacter freundii]AOI31115.1 hypothetical protein BFQ28_15260 [Citrobacter freundii]
MTTNNHPAHGPVSLDRLHQIREILSKAAAQSDGGNLGHAMADAVKVIDGVIAVFDEKPVAYIFKHPAGRLFWALTDESNKGQSDVMPVYAAPRPAPVVPENCVTAEHRRVIEMLLNVCGAAFELADDSCQQDVDGEECHVVPDDAFQKLSEALDEIENTLPTEDVDRPDVFLSWSAMPRAALKSILQAGNSPVIGVDLASGPDRTVEVRYVAPPGYVMVPKEMTDAIGEAIAMQANCCGGIALDIYDAMLAAAPQQEVKSALEHGMRRYAGAMQKLSEGDD